MLKRVATNVGAEGEVVDEEWGLAHGGGVESFGTYSVSVDEGD